METLVCKTNPERPSSRAIDAAAEAILNGRLIVFPTETVYGIGANAFDEKACKEIYKVKGRASDNPLIVHVYRIEDAMKLGSFSREHAEVLSRIWPGPLTVIVKGKGILPETVTAGLDSVAIRCPKGRVIRSIIKKAGVPIAAPSANISTKPSSTKGEHAIGYFRGKVAMIIDGGEADYGIESTILDLRSFRILRPGAFTPEQIERAFGRKPILGRLAEGTTSAKRVISPGTKYRHYAPSTPLFVYTGDRRAVYSLVRPFGRSAAYPRPLPLNCSTIANFTPRESSSISLSKSLCTLMRRLLDGPREMHLTPVPLNILQLSSEPMNAALLPKGLTKL